MEEFEPTIYKINKNIKPAWEDIKYLSEKLVINQDCPRSYIGGMLNAIAIDLNEITIQKTTIMNKDKLSILFNRSWNRWI